MAEEVFKADAGTINGSQTLGNGEPVTEKELKDAVNYMMNGKRQLLLHDYSAAVTSFEEATRLYDQIYGTGADECGEAYLYYGIGALELSRQETGALDGGVVSANILESSDEEDEDEEEEAAGDADVKPENGDISTKPTEESVAPAESSKQLSDTEDIGESDNEKPEPAASVVSSSSTITHEPQPGSSSGSAAEPIAGTSNGNGTAEEAEDDAEASTAEVAWEVLGLARDVFKRQIMSGIDMKLKLAEALQKLGEISIEWENYEVAIDILQESLSLRKESLPEDDRLIAETYYHIGVSFSFSGEGEKANDCFRSAVNVIEERLENLQKYIKSIEGYTEEKSLKELEVIELETLLPEMKGKIEDSNEQMNIAKEEMKKQVTEVVQELAYAAKLTENTDNKPVNNISHLIKRKRNTSADNGEITKKVCAGDAPANSEAVVPSDATLNAE